MHESHGKSRSLAASHRFLKPSNKKKDSLGSDRGINRIQDSQVNKSNLGGASNVISKDPSDNLASNPYKLNLNFQNNSVTQSQPKLAAAGASGLLRVESSSSVIYDERGAAEQASGAGNGPQHRLQSQSLNYSSMETI